MHNIDDIIYIKYIVQGTAVAAPKPKKSSLDGLVAETPPNWEEAIAQDEAVQAAQPAMLLLRLPIELKAALTKEAAKRTFKAGTRISVNALIVDLVTQAIVMASD
jgi:hypothetical protein